jgi:hypothetical protein
MLFLGCDQIDRPTAPSVLPPQPPTTGQPSPAPGVPPASGPARTFDFAGPLSYPVSGYTQASKYVLYENGAFALQYSAGQYIGSYHEERGDIIFRFADDSRWEARGTLNGDRLGVRYNQNMELSDFENAVYSRVP